MAGDLTFSGEGSAARNARRIARWRQLAIVCTSLPDQEAVYAGKRCCLPLDERLDLSCHTPPVLLALHYARI